MANRNQFTARERAARSRLAQLLHDFDVIVGGVVTMERTCGKLGCRCARGEKHVSLYLSTKVDGKRRMIYIPADLEEAVRQRVAAYREVAQLTEEVSNACVGRALERKRKGTGDGQQG